MSGPLCDQQGTISLQVQKDQCDEQQTDSDDDDDRPSRGHLSSEEMKSKKFQKQFLGALRTLVT